jgi:hypothetical protein
MSSPNHSFSVDFASIYGVHEAILIHHFQHWIRHNKATGRNQHDGKTWSYQKLEDIAAHFPYLSKSEVFELIERLCIGKGRRSKKDSLDFDPVLVKGNYNNSPYDKTTWYAFVNEEKFAILAQAKIVIAPSQNRDCPEPTPIPDTKTDTKPDVVCSEPPVGVSQKEISSENITKKNARGETISISKSEIFRRAISQPNWKTGHIQQAIITLESYGGIVNDLWAFIEGTVTNLHNKTIADAINKKNFKQGPSKSKIEPISPSLPQKPIIRKSMGEMYPEFFK